jgi:anti-sigma-K factor RskA
MSSAEHINEDELTLFALQLLGDDEQNTVVNHLESCEQCRVTVAELQGDLVAYAMSAETHSPPAAARDRLLRQVGKEKKLVPIDHLQHEAAHTEPVLASRNSLLFADSHEEARRSHTMAFLGWAGWAVAASVAVFAGLQFHQRQELQQTVASLSAHPRAGQSTEDAARAEQALNTLTSSGATLVNLRTPPPSGSAPPANPEGHVAYIADSGAMVFYADHLKPLPDYKTYELWVLPANGHDPIAAGIFKPDPNGSANVVMPDLPKGVPASGFGVTIEDDGGSKTPTKPVVLVGTV